MKAAQEYPGRWQEAGMDRDLRRALIPHGPQAAARRATSFLEDYWEVVDPRINRLEFTKDETETIRVERFQCSILTGIRVVLTTL